MGPGSVSVRGGSNIKNRVDSSDAVQSRKRERVVVPHSSIKQQAFFVIIVISSGIRKRHARRDCGCGRNNRLGLRVIGPL